MSVKIQEKQVTRTVDMEEYSYYCDKCGKLIATEEFDIADDWHPVPNKVKRISSYNCRFEFLGSTYRPQKDLFLCDGCFDKYTKDVEDFIFNIAKLEK